MVTVRKAGGGGKPKLSTVKVSQKHRVEQDGRKLIESLKDVNSHSPEQPPIPPPPLPPTVVPLELPLYTLPHTQQLPLGVVPCDPTTGVPLVGRSLGGAPLMLPPCIRVATAVPLEYTSPPVATEPSLTVEQECQTSEGPSVADVGLQTSFTSDNHTPRAPHLTQQVH